MKFRDDCCGWRDLRIERGADCDNINVSIDTKVKSPSYDGAHFISISYGGNYASFYLSRNELRKFAKAILKETDK